MIKLNQIWNNVLLEAESKVSTLAYDVYINALSPVGIYRERLILMAENKALKNIVDNHYKEIIQQATQKVFPTIAEIEIITEDSLEQLQDVQKEVDIPVSSDAFLNTEDESLFVEAYTFDNFIVGKSNEFAAAVCKAVAENPGTKYNPLFIWGGVGLGKTHLLHAIGNYLRKNAPTKMTLYTSSEKFTNEVIEAVRSNDVNAKKNFRKKYRSLDILMIDDIQFLAKTEVTQEEFFHTFNDLYLAEKQIIICSDRPPKEINIEERLQTRFATGIIADIKPPDLETRIAILQKKAANIQQKVSMDVLRLIAEKITSNIREMEGMLHRIVSYAKLIGNGDCNNMAVVNEALKDYSDTQKEILTIDQIVDATCEYFQVDKQELKGKKKKKEVVVPRQICVYLITEMLSTVTPLTSIGLYFGGRDHSTIIYARDKISEQVKTDAVLAAQVKDIKDKILNR